MASAVLSGIEWATEMNSTSNGPIYARSDGDDLDRNLRRARFTEPPRLGQPGGEAGHIDRRAEARPKFGKRADVILVRVSNDDADEIAFDLLDEGEVGHDQIDARRLVAGEGETEIDHQPFAALGRPEAIERAIHADLAQAP